MLRRPICFCLLLSLLVYFSALPGGLGALENQEAENKENSENALNRLIGISTQLSTLNERLRSELQDSRQNSRELQTMLEASRRELEELRQELMILRNNSTGLLIKAENSQTELTALQTTLRRAESSLMSLEISFWAYRETAEKTINTLERKNKFLKWGLAAAGIAAAGFGIAFFAGR